MGSWGKANPRLQCLNCCFSNQRPALLWAPPRQAAPRWEGRQHWLKGATAALGEELHDPSTTQRTDSVITFSPFPSSYCKTSVLAPPKQSDWLVALVSALWGLEYWAEETLGISSGFQSCFHLWSYISWLALLHSYCKYKTNRVSWLQYSQPICWIKQEGTRRGRPVGQGCGFREERSFTSCWAWTRRGWYWSDLRPEQRSLREDWPHSLEEDSQGWSKFPQLTGSLLWLCRALSFCSAPWRN